MKTTEEMVADARAKRLEEELAEALAELERAREELLIARGWDAKNSGTVRTIDAVLRKHGRLP